MLFYRIFIQYLLNFYCEKNLKKIDNKRFFWSAIKIYLSLWNEREFE